MRRVWRKTTVALLLTGYSLAVTVGGAFHIHLGADCCSEEGHVADCCHCHHCDAGQTHMWSEKSAGEANFHGLEAFAVPVDSHCPICSFLSQKPITVAVHASEDSAELEQPLVRVKSIPPSDDIPSTIFSRGPPLFA